MLGRSEVESNSCFFIHPLFCSLGFFIQLFGIVVQKIHIDLHTLKLHILEYLHQRIVYFIKYLLYVFLLQPVNEHILQLQGDVCIFHCILFHTFQLNITHGTLVLSFFADELFNMYRLITEVLRA